MRQLVWLEGAVLGRPLWLICWLMDFQEYETQDPQTHLLELILLACICFFRNSINTEEIFNTRDCEASDSSNCLLPPHAFSTTDTYLTHERSQHSSD